MDYPKTRQEAKAVGAIYYYTGLPCIRGHIALRKTKGSCVECMKEDWKKDNDKRKLQPKSEAAKEAGIRYYERNRAQVIARASARPLSDKQRYKKAHKDRNPEYYKILNSLRKRRHKDATPQWLTYAQKRDIKALYQQAMELTRVTGVRYVVDHYIPLNNPDVCGLHVPWNLRVITQEENLKKSNSFDSDS
jgi:hypothetical protein